jgi:superfamily II DNA or RNA helicase
MPASSILSSISLNTIKNLPDITNSEELFVDIAKTAKTYLGNRGYCVHKDSIDEKTKTFIRTSLMAKPRVLNSPVESNSFPIYLESSNKLYLPRYFGIKYFGIPKEIKICPGKNIDVKFTGQLRDYQIDIINSYLDYIDYTNLKALSIGKGGGLIEVGCGRGKTVMALKIIEVLKKKTLIIVHKEFLKNQWIERINEFLPNTKIGTLQGQVIDIDDKDIVIAMLQSLSQKDYPVETFQEFGLTIIDEGHHISSESFSKALQKTVTQYVLGISATMERKDGLSWVFKAFLGEIVYKEKQLKQDNVLVKAIEYRVENDDEYNHITLDYRGNPQYSTMITKLCNYNSRSEFIITVIRTELLLKPNQQIILLSHNKSLLNYIFKAVGHRNICQTGYYIGGMKEKDLKISESKQLILATYSMAAEALDIKSLTTLILATPKTDIVQASGRIMRQPHEQPLIIDIVDTHDLFVKQFAKRKKYYHDNNYQVITTSTDLYNRFSNKFSIKIKNRESIDALDDIWKPLNKNGRSRKSNPIQKSELEDTDSYLNTQLPKCLISLD